MKKTSGGEIEVRMGPRSLGTLNLSDLKAAFDVRALSHVSYNTP